MDNDEFFLLFEDLDLDEGFALAQMNDKEVDEYIAEQTCKDLGL